MFLFKQMEALINLQFSINMLQSLQLMSILDDNTLSFLRHATLISQIQSVDSCMRSLLHKSKTKKYYVNNILMVFNK